MAFVFTFGNGEGIHINGSGNPFFREPTPQERHQSMLDKLRYKDYLKSMQNVTVIEEKDIVIRDPSEPKNKESDNNQDISSSSCDVTTIEEEKIEISGNQV